MKLLFSALATIDFDGLNYYNTNIISQIGRYKPFCDEMVCLAYKKDVTSSKQDMIKDDVDFIFLDKSNSLKSLLAGSRLNRSIIEKAVQEADACIIHVFSMYGQYVVRAAKKYNKPYCTVVVGCPWDAYWNYNLKGKLIAPFNYLTLRRIQRNVSHTIYVTEKFLQSRYPSKGLQTNCSNVEIDAGKEEVLDNRISRIGKRQETDILKIGTVAAIDVKYKGQEYVIRAIGKLKEKGIDNIDYSLVGSGDSNRLMNIAQECNVEDSIHFMGTLPHNKVVDFLDSIDVYIQPSKQEGLPRALIEAMSRGCLCIGSRVAGIPELLEKDFLFPKGNARQLSDILQGINKEVLGKQAYVNFKKATGYDRHIINTRRNNFLKEFFQTIK